MLQWIRTKFSSNDPSRAIQYNTNRNLYSVTIPLKTRSVMLNLVQVCTCQYNMSKDIIFMGYSVYKTLFSKHVSPVPNFKLSSKLICILILRFYVENWRY